MKIYWLFVTLLADFQKRRPDNCHPKRRGWLVGGYFSWDWKNWMVPFELCQRNRNSKCMFNRRHTNKPNQCKESANQGHDREGARVRGWDREPADELLGKNEDFKYVSLNLKDESASIVPKETCRFTFYLWRPCLFILTYPFKIHYFYSFQINRK